MEANIKKREDCLDEVIRHVTGLRDTWREAIQKFKAAGGVLDSYTQDKYSKSTQTEDDDEDDTNESDEDEDEDDDNDGEYA